MNQKFKRILSLMMTMVFILCTIAATGVTAFAAGERDVWYVGWTEGYGEYIGWLGKGADFSVDTNNYYKESRYSIRMDNNADEYNYTCIDKTIAVEPLTAYRFSAMVKYEGHQLDPAATGDLKGAFLREFYINEEGKWVNHNYSKTTTSGEWTKLECFFTTVEGQRTATLNLFNGYTNTLNKGTAWFSDIKVEKVDKTNQWDVLLLVLKNVEAEVTLDGETYTYTDNFNNEDVAYIRDDIVGRMKNSVHVMSDELVNIKNIDTYAIEDIVTEKELRTALNDDGSVKGYFLDVNSDKIADIISTYTAKKNYNQIIFFLPVQGISRYWLGLGGSKTQNIHFCQLNYKTGTESYHWKNKDGSIFPESAVIHEILHGVDNDSRTLYDSNTPTLHENIGIYSEYYNGDDGWYTYQCDYMTKNLPDGRGIDPRAFWRPNGKYTLYNNEMEVGGLIDISALPLDITRTSVSPIKDRAYTGSSITPAITITDNNYVLRSGTDYTLSYKNNTAAGTATVTATGKGIYTGTKSATFKIVTTLACKPTNIVATAGDSKVTFAWNAVPNAERYSLSIYDPDTGKYTLRSSQITKTTYTTSKLTNGKQYQFLIRAYVDGKWSPYTSADLVKAT
ncbi:MAG: carbohydrate binding domain-containing protein, partial [Oscillospiraceae bacterium]|nr:carbohydrate binding domain-containing protein [Oscillospiraceae bacterium]